MATKTYDPKKISVIIGGVTAHGFGDGDFITIEYNEDQWNLKVGADGESTRTKNANLSAKITVTLLHSSETNKDLQVQALADLFSGSGVTSFALLDEFGREGAAATTMWCTKLPNIVFGKDAPDREWVFETDELLMKYVPVTPT